MRNVTTYVGIDAHEKDSFIAILVGRDPQELDPTKNVAEFAFSSSAVVVDEPLC